MNTDPHIITVSGVRVQVVRKAIKNLHLGVYPPAGRVRVAAPLCCITPVVPVQVATRSLTWTSKPSWPILDFASFALMVASISASLNLPSLCDLVRELAHKDHEQAKQNAEAPRDSRGAP